MLDPVLKRVTEKVAGVMSSHRDSVDEKTMFSRDWEFIFSDFNGWVTLHCFSYSEIGSCWVYPKLYPRSKLEKLRAELPSFSFHQPSAAYDHVMCGDDHWIEPFWQHNEDLKTDDVPLFFHREHCGRPKGNEHYLEFNQLVTHPLGLHWSESKQAFCSVDDNGDEIEKIKIIDDSGVSLIVIRRKTLDKLLYLGDWALVRYVDFHRREKGHLDYREAKRKTVESEIYDAKYELRNCGLKFVEFHGAQIEMPKSDREKLLSLFEDEEGGEKKYADLIVHDWKNKRLLEGYSLDPDNFSNYFTESDLPFETSPLFFRADVLDKYKNNTDKYELSERGIYCRGGWHLETYDINEYNQVHTYAVYLGRLPYREQLHWLQYNEKPKGGLSKRAVRTDFEGQFSELSDLQELKKILEELQCLEVKGAGSPVWSPKGGSWDNASRGLHQVCTENSNQWHDFIIALANTVNEGLQKKPLWRLAQSLGCENKELGSLGLLKYIFGVKDQSELIESVHFTLNELQIARGQGKAHGAWKAPDGSLVEDSKKRVVDVVGALKELKAFLHAFDPETCSNSDGGENAGSDD
jgi:hypothetical protein